MNLSHLSAAAPTQLPLSSYSTHKQLLIKLQLRHLLRCTVTDANRRVDSLQHSGALAMWTGPGDDHTLLEVSGLAPGLVKKNRGRNGRKTGVGMV